MRVLSILEAHSCCSAGTFNQFGDGTSASPAAQWSAPTKTLTALGGPTQPVYTTYYYNNQVFFGGSFVRLSSEGSGSTSAHRRITRWDIPSGTWKAMAGGLETTVYTIIGNGQSVYVGGLFTVSYSSSSDTTGTTARHVARFSLTTNLWVNIASFSASWSGGVKVLAFAAGTLYAGLGSGAPSAVSINYLARNTNPTSTSSAWTQVGVGVNSPVNVSALHVWLDSLLREISVLRHCPAPRCFILLRDTAYLIGCAIMALPLTRHSLHSFSALNAPTDCRACSTSATRCTLAARSPVRWAPSTCQSPTWPRWQPPAATPSQPWGRA